VGTATSVNFIKLLKSTGKYKVLGTDLNPLGYTAGSMLVDKFFQVDGFDSNQYLSQIEKIINNEKIDLFIPIHDLEIEKVLMQGLHVEHCKFILPALECIRLFSNKALATQKIMELGIDVPEIITNQVDLIQSNAYIVRPIQSVGSKGIVFFNEITDELKSFFNKKDYFVQNRVFGKEFTVDVVCNDNGEPNLIIPRERIEVKAGVATKVKITYDEKLISIVQKILKNYRLPGFSNIQFIQQEGKYYFIELNCRFGGMSIASTMASYNYVDEYIDSLFTGNLKETNYESNMKSVKWGAIISRYYEEIIYCE
jgi:carbamoyl-phosphate synthase large subunit